MMKEIPIKLGPLALLLTVISICLTTLAILTFTTARADKSLADTFAATVTERYQLEAEGQRFLSEIAADPFSASLMADEGPDFNGIYWRTIENENGASLRIGFTLTGADGYEVRVWKQEKSWEEDDEMGNLWMGF